MPFTFEETYLRGLYLVHARVFGDERGYFLETYREREFRDEGIDIAFVQDNQSLSKKGILRGLHFQLPPFAQGKLVRVATGRIWDVAVDLRRDSETFGKWFGVELSEETQTMLYISPGFAHGFLTLEDDTRFLYKCTKEYSPEHERGIRYDDSEIGISWPITDVVVSERDKALPLFSEAIGTLDQIV